MTVQLVSQSQPIGNTLRHGVIIAIKEKDRPAHYWKIDNTNNHAYAATIEEWERFELVKIVNTTTRQTATLTGDFYNNSIEVGNSIAFYNTHWSRFVRELAEGRTGSPNSGNDTRVAADEVYVIQSIESYTP